jgi:hypothetical protein
LNAKYLTVLWNALNDPTSSLLLDEVRAQWRAAKEGDLDPLLATIQAVAAGPVGLHERSGHIGKRDGPKAWQAPVNPLAASHEVRLQNSDRCPPTKLRFIS